MSPTRSCRRLRVGDLMTLWAEGPATPMNIAMLGLLEAAGLMIMSPWLYV